MFRFVVVVCSVGICCCFGVAVEAENCKPVSSVPSRIIFLDGKQGNACVENSSKGLVDIFTTP